MNETVESGQTNLEAANQAGSQPSGQGGDKQSSQTNTSGEFVSVELFNTAIKEIKAEVRGVQGDKDRLGNRNQTEINKMKDLLEKIGKWDLSPAMKEELGDMKQQTEFDELRAEIESIKSSRNAVPTAPQTTDEFLSIISEANLNPNDPAVVELAQQFQGNRIGFAVALGEKKAGVTTPVSPVASVTGSGMGEPPPQTDKSLADEFAKKYTDALREGRREDAMQIRVDYRKAGVQVDNFVLEHKPTY